MKLLTKYLNIYFMIILSSFKCHLTKIYPIFREVLVLQGGGALGAYDAGVFQALYDNINTDNVDHCLILLQVPLAAP